MIKTALLSCIAIATLAKHSHQTTDQWPDVKHETTFKSSVSVYSWDNHTLSDFKSITADLKVDSQRNKAIAIAKIQIPLFGLIDAQVLVDFTTGKALGYVPFIGLCQRWDLNTSLSLYEYLTQAFDPKSGMTQFLGAQAPKWDNSTPSWMFHHDTQVQGQQFDMNSFFEISSANLRWLYFTANGVTVKFQDGMKPAQFSDSDFVINGCTMAVAKKQEIEDERALKKVQSRKHKKLSEEVKKAIRRIETFEEIKVALLQE